MCGQTDDRTRARAWRRRNPQRAREYQRNYYRRAKNGEIQLPQLDWAICANGGSEAQARAHRLRGEKPCANCLKASARRKRERKAHNMSLTDYDVMKNLATLNQVAMNQYSATAGTSIHDVAQHVEKALKAQRYKPTYVAKLLAYAIADQAHAQHHGDWA
jgi:hypothetical protein